MTLEYLISNNDQNVEKYQKFLYFETNFWKYNIQKETQADKIRQKNIRQNGYNSSKLQR